MHDRVVRDMPDARSNDEDREEERVSSCRPAHLAQNKFTSLLLHEVRHDRRRRNNGLATSDGEGVTTYPKNDRLCPPRCAVIFIKVEPECCVLCFFHQVKKKIFETLRSVEIGTNSTYLHACMLKINSSPVKSCKKSQQILKKFSELGLRIFLN